MTKAEYDAGVGRNRTPEEIAAYRAQLAHWNARREQVFVGSGSMAGPNWEDAGSVEFSRCFPTEADAQAFVATLPKSLKARATTMSGHLPNGAVSGYVWLRASLAKDGVNGGVNETGLKRLKVAARVLTFEWNPHTCANSMTEEFFRNLLK